MSLPRGVEVFERPLQCQHNNVPRFPCVVGVRPVVHLHLAMELGNLAVLGGGDMIFLEVPVYP